MDCHRFREARPLDTTILPEFWLRHIFSILPDSWRLRPPSSRPTAPHPDPNSLPCRNVPALPEYDTHSRLPIPLPGSWGCHIRRAAFPPSLSGHHPEHTSTLHIPTHLAVAVVWSVHLHNDLQSPTGGKTAQE